MPVTLMQGKMIKLFLIAIDNYQKTSHHSTQSTRLPQRLPSENASQPVFIALQQIATASNWMQWPWLHEWESHI